MHDRHTNRQAYFDEQVFTTKEHVIPYIEKTGKIGADWVVAEIGCGEAGNLKPFLDNGLNVTGIDISASKIENARKFYETHPYRNKLNLIASDIYDIEPEQTGKFDLVIMRDTIEHIPQQAKFIGHLKKFLKPNGRIFFGFPPWRMPFGGHQQLCSSKLLSRLPYYHLLPKPAYIMLLKAFGESQEKVDCLMEVRDTRISIAEFGKIIKENNLKILSEDFFLINPNYEIKFKLKTRKLPVLLNIPYFRDFFTTACYYLIGN